MTKSLEEIQQKEQQLALKIEQLEEETRHVNQLEEEYEDFFHHTSALFTEIEEQFSQNSFNEFLSDRRDGLHHQRFHIFGDIDEERQQLHKQQQTITDTQSELFYERETLLSNEEVSVNDY